MNGRIAVQVGKNIREIRLKKGLSQDLLARLSHTGIKSIRDMENGRLTVTLVRASKIAGVLGCPLSELFKDLVFDA
jgi:transcriptional regulator with XRE-family HTH domain